MLASKVKQELGVGAALSEELAVEVINWKLQQPEVRARGAVLDDFPRTQLECVLLFKKGIVPNPLFYLDCTVSNSQKRTGSKFKHGNFAVEAYLKRTSFENAQILSWYQNTFDNVRYLNTDHSKWWVRDSATKYINEVFGAKRSYALAKLLRKPVSVKNLEIERREINSRLSDFGRYDPITWKLKADLVKVSHNDYLIEKGFKFYVFENQKNLNTFLEAPEKFTKGKLPEHLPRKLKTSESGQIDPEDLELEGYCPVVLTENNSLQKGKQTVLASYKEKVFAFTSNEARSKFLRKPHKYENAQLPKKIPPKPN